jgi:hypothetical protein
MTEEEYRTIISSYQQKSFELFNSNVLLETQVQTLKKEIERLNLKLQQQDPKSEGGGDDF